MLVWVRLCCIWYGKPSRNTHGLALINGNIEAILNLLKRLTERFEATDLYSEDVGEGAHLDLALF